MTLSSINSDPKAQEESCSSAEHGRGVKQALADKIIKNGGCCGADHADHHHTEDPNQPTLLHKQILTRQDLDDWLISSAYLEFTEYIAALNSAALNRTLTQEGPISNAVDRVLDLLRVLKDELIPAHPAVENEKSRFGNPAFRSWSDAMALLVPVMLKDAFLTTSETSLNLGKVSLEEGLMEAAEYLINSFGSRKRIDYGTGHEAHFAAFLLCLSKLGIFDPSDMPALVLQVFWAYIGVMRALQREYWLEPAGSHGVWGLDDYHFLPFYFGSAQLHDHKHLRPKSIREPANVEAFSADYMYFACIQFINSVKSASLRWHSPMLDDISGVKTWSKVNSGMMKMYKGEVLSKLPIMQHFLFGKLLSFTAPSAGHEASSELVAGKEHVYAFGMEAPTCCGMRIPSKFGSSSGVAPRPLPFD